MVKKIVLIVVFGLLALNTVSAIKCYQCSDCPDHKELNATVCKEEIFPTTVAPPTTVTTPKGEEGSPNPNPNPNPTDDTLKYLNKYNRAGEGEGEGEEEGEAEDNNFRCLKYTDKNDKINRRCTKRLCDTIKGEQELKVCNTCEKEGCNFGTNIQSWTLSTIIFVAIVKYIM